jgi:hypothetical protein
MLWMEPLFKGPGPFPFQIVATEQPEDSVMQSEFAQMRTAAKEAGSCMFPSLAQVRRLSGTYIQGSEKWFDITKACCRQHALVASCELLTCHPLVRVAELDRKRGCWSNKVEQARQC